MAFSFLARLFGKRLSPSSPEATAAVPPVSAEEPDRAPVVFSARAEPTGESVAEPPASPTAPPRPAPSVIAPRFESPFATVATAVLAGAAGARPAVVPGDAHAAPVPSGAAPLSSIAPSDSGARVSLRLAPLLQGQHPGALGFAPERVPAHVRVSLPAEPLTAQLATGRIRVRLDQVVAGLDPRFRPAFKQARPDLELNVPLRELLEHLPVPRLSPPATGGVPAVFTTPFSIHAEEDAGLTTDAMPFPRRVDWPAPATAAISPSRFVLFPDDPPAGPPAAKSPDTPPLPPAVPPRNPFAFPPGTGLRSTLGLDLPFLPLDEDPVPLESLRDEAPAPRKTPITPPAGTESPRPGRLALSEQQPQPPPDAASATTATTATTAATAADAAPTASVTAPPAAAPPASVLAESPFSTLPPILSAAAPQPSDDHRAAFVSVFAPSALAGSTDGSCPPLADLEAPPAIALAKLPPISHDPAAAGASAPPVPEPPLAAPVPAPSPLGMDSPAPADPVPARHAASAASPEIAGPAVPAPSAPVPAPASTPAVIEDLSFGYVENTTPLVLRAVFATDGPLSLQDVVDRAARFDGLRACLVHTPHTCRHTAAAPDDPEDVRHFRERAAALFEKTAGLVREMDPSAREQSFTLRTGTTVASFFAVDEICLAVLHADPNFRPGVREKLTLIARSLPEMTAA